MMLVRRGTRIGLASLPFLLRLASLVGKFGLSLYIARYLSLDDFGLYGLVFSAAMIAVVLYGGRIDHDLARRIVTMSEVERMSVLRDTSVFFVFNGLVALPPFLVAGVSLGMSPSLIGLAFAICWLESYSNFLFVVISFLGRPILANLVFFIRAGGWAFVAIGAGLAVPAARSLWFVLALWAAGTLLSIVVSLWALAATRWPGFRTVALDWPRIRAAFRISLPIWIGSIGLAGGSYLDRFILGSFLDLKAVGLATFYTSFTAAILNLVSSGVLVPAAPRLVSAAASDGGAYGTLLRRAGLAAIGLGGFLCLLVGVAVPYSAAVLQKPEIAENLLALWLLMGATLLRLAAETAFHGLYARHRDREIWLGNIVFLAASLLLSLAFIPFLGLTGLGVASVAASLLLLVMRREGLRRGQLPV